MYASNAVRFEQSVRDTLDQLKICGRKDSKENAFQLLQNWLIKTSNGPWLIVIDNADDACVLLEKPTIDEQADVTAKSVQYTKARLDYLPQCDHGKVLVTSRDEYAAMELVDQKDVITVGPMEDDEALALLRKKLDVWYVDQHAPSLAQELEKMPLALAQAAAYMFQSKGRCSIQQYLKKLEEYDKSGGSILDVEKKDLRRDREASNSIILTWQISFNHIRKVRQSATDLLSLMSFFDREAISQTLLQEKGDPQAKNEVNRHKGTRVESTGVDSKDRDKAHENAEDNAVSPVDKIEEFEENLVVLRNYNFVSLTTDPRIFEMHRLVQLATKKWLKANGQLEHWGSKFIGNLENAFPTSRFENWEICRSLFPHTTAAFHTEVTNREAVLQQASLFIRSGQYASATGAYADAKRMEEWSLNTRKRVLGEWHLDTLTSMGNLAQTYLLQGQWEEAEKLQVEVMEKFKEVLREGHPDTLASMNNLAMTYSDQGQWEEAEKLQVEVMEKSKDVLGEGHPNMLRSMNNLAATYSRQGQWEEAEKLQMEVMEKCKGVLREGHPDVLTSMNNLAMTYSDQGQWEEAEKLQVEVMKKCKEVLGEGHPDTLTSMDNLAHTYLLQGQWEEAEKLQVEVIEKSKEVLREGHPNMLRSMNNLAATYLQQGQWEQAEKLQMEVIEKSKEVLGEGHPDTLGSMANLAFMLRALGRHQSALDLMSSCINKSANVLPTDHPDARAYWQVKIQWEKEDSLQSGGDVVGSISNKPPSRRTNTM
jgi:tetratricopeptide (TPR) repeat protein